MFCPEGYVSLYDTVLAFEQIAFEWWAQKGAAIEQAEHDANKENYLRQYGNLSGYVDFGLDEDTPTYAYRRWATFRFVFRFSDNFFVSSPSGKLMRLGQYAFEAGRLFDGPFPETRKGQSDLIDHVKYGFWHFDEYYFIIEPCADIEIIETFRLEKEVVILDKFRGWAICWKPKSLDGWRDELRAILDDEATPLPVRRHRLSDERNAATLIVEMYDKDDQVTKAACRERIGRSLGTLAFNRAWDAAKAKRPGLGMGGRPKSKPQT